jgi:hypothetical protein
MLKLGQSFDGYHRFLKAKQIGLENIKGIVLR